MRALYAVFPDTPPYGGAFADPTPHFMVAQATTDAELDQVQQRMTPVLAPHLPLTRRVDALTVWEEDHSGQWHDVAAIGLAAARHDAVV